MCESYSSNKEVPITISFGLANIPNHGNTSRELKICTGSALFDVKHDGKILLLYLRKPEISLKDKTIQKYGY